eukprot:1072108-Prymnesium_polylepis.2
MGQAKGASPFGACKSKATRPIQWRDEWFVRLRNPQSVHSQHDTEILCRDQTPPTTPTYQIGGRIVQVCEANPPPA